MDARSDPRFKKRMPCNLKNGQRRHSGMILDISRTGLFVQTSAPAKTGDEVEIQLNAGRATAPITLIAQVSWIRMVPAQLRSVAEGGLGLQIRYAQEEYYGLLSDAARGLRVSGERTL